MDFIKDSLICNSTWIWSLHSKNNQCPYVRLFRIANIIHTKNLVQSVNNLASLTYLLAIVPF